MGKYQPLNISGYKTGLVQSRENFLLPNDAYPVLQNAYVWRERLLRKQGTGLLGRLRRELVAQNLGNTTGGGTFSGNIKTILGLEANSHLECGSISIAVGATIFTDPAGDGILVGGGGGTINYVTGAVSIAGAPGATPILATFGYFPNLPVMGIRSRELNNVNFEQTVVFDTTYAYIPSATGFVEFIPGTIWTGTDSDFFWTTNYYVDNPVPAANRKIFWATNDSGTAGDPIRYTNGVAWANFSPDLDGVNFLNQCTALLPFRGRLLAFNTWEGPTLGTSINFRQRIRWSQIGTPFDVVSAVVPAGNVVANAWRDNVRGRGSYLDIPTAQNIIAVGFVRDNLIIYCESSTWQLRYTGRSINPFEVEKVNTELGAESTFSAIQFDTSLVGVGDKGIVECDSFKSNRIDIKIPDLVFDFNNEQEGPKRVQGARDFERRLAYWTYPYENQMGSQIPVIYPNRRLVYNYENDSWAIFNDSFTALGPFQSPLSTTWANTPKPWEEQNYPWVSRTPRAPIVLGGNQQGYVSYLDVQTTNDVSLAINNITGNVTTATSIESFNHNLETGQWIKISGIPTGTPFANLNGQVFFVQSIPSDPDNFLLYVYDPLTDGFLPQLDPVGVFVGCGQIAVRDNFNIVSKKFNFIEQGQAVQIGFIDVLMDETSEGAISLNMYLDYADNLPVNILPENNTADPFFNSVVPTTNPRGISPLNFSKNWHRVYCSTRGTFLTIEWTLSKAQMAGTEQEQNVQIDSQIIWLRKAGTQIPLGV